jgi:Ca-activated chloride channel family protein
MARRPLILTVCFTAFAHSATAQQPVADVSPSNAPAATVRITSPLGRTGLVTRVRIVAQVDAPPPLSLSPLEFFVDGALVGTVESGPPYSVDWTDANPFEEREIVVQARDSAGNMVRNRVVLPAFEIADKTEVTRVLLETGVYDEKGFTVASLDPSALRVLENGIEQAIDIVLRESVSTDVLLLVDNSQSMSRRMDFVKTACARLARALRKGDRIIVAPFNARIGTITGPTDDAPTVEEAIAGMRANGGTAVLDSLIEAARLLKSASTGRRAVVLMTDGYDEASKADLDSVKRVLEDAQTTVYAVGIGGVAGISLKGELMLREIAEHSGGRVFFPPREQELVAVASTVATDAHNRYLITYTPNNQRQDGAWRQVSVAVPSGYTARTRAGYYAPAPPPIRPSLEFTVMDASSRSYVDVTAEDVDVFEDGVGQVVDTFQQAINPVSIVLTLDSSGSMKNSADLVRATAKDFVAEVRPEDSLALITFADKPKFEHVLAQNRQWTLDAIDKYVPLGGTALYDALWNSLVHLKPVKGRRTVVILTDGRDENNPGTAPGSTHTLEEVLKLRREVDAVIYAVGLGDKVDAPVLQRLADESGGQAYFATDASSLGLQFKRVVESMRRRYVLSYTSTNSDYDGGWRSVVVRTKIPGSVVTVNNGGYYAPRP